ncbi:MAG TPA: hypothetical protein VKA44_09660 [Gemmatimonadota bacterium]|nr:hypothetical protein [Gemmatimonadota bacterium]
MTGDGGPKDEPSAPVTGALEAGAAVRQALRTYRSRYGEAARALAREPGPSDDASEGFATLRSDWERTVAAFRETVDRVGTLQKTLARDS